MRGKLIGIVLAVGLLATVPATAGHLGPGFYFTSCGINTPETNHLGPGSWVIRASVFYDRWGETPVIGFPGGNVGKDLTLGYGFTEWLEAGVIVFGMEEYIGEIELRLLKETPRRPALSVGVLARLDKADSIFYLVAGKHNLALPLLGKSAVHIGVGGLIAKEAEHGECCDKLQGIFASIDKVYWPQGWKRPLTFRIESDTKDINLGLSYELFKGLKVSAALGNVGGLFNDTAVRLLLAVCLFKA